MDRETLNIFVVLDNETIMYNHNIYKLVRLNKCKKCNIIITNNNSKGFCNFCISKSKTRLFINNNKVQPDKKIIFD